MTVGGSVAPPALTGDSNLRANAHDPKKWDKAHQKRSEGPPADVDWVRGRTRVSSVSYPARRAAAAAAAVPFRLRAGTVERQPP